MGKLKVLSPRGDDEIPWLAEDPASAAAAKEIFEAKRSAGCAAFLKVPDGHELIKTFDPDAEEILIVKPLVGG